ncbi:MAG: DUF3368 domain-containing protein [Myxococcales bacterium]
MRIPVAVAEELDCGAAILGDWRAVLLDAGEANALALAASNHADLVLMDEVRGRAVARRLGLAVLGTLGLIATAKKRGLIPAARPVIAQVRSRGGLWLADKLVAEVLAGLDE